MVVPIGFAPGPERSAGCTYAAVLVRCAHRSDAGDALLAVLRHVRFSGWVAPAEDGWIPLVCAGAGVVAAKRHGVVGVAEALAAELATTTLAVRVLDDRQLVLAAWQSRGELARYVSDPAREPDADQDVLPEPFGSEGAGALAEVCFRPDVDEELERLLAESLSPDDEIESERLGRVLHLLALPSWLVTAWRLPRELPTGPSRRDLQRLRAGRTGPPGWLAGGLAGIGRRWRLPPPVLVEPPRGDDGFDDLAMWL